MRISLKWPLSLERVEAGDGLFPRWDTEAPAMGFPRASVMKPAHTVRGFASTSIVGCGVGLDGLVREPGFPVKGMLGAGAAILKETRATATDNKISSRSMIKANPLEECRWFI